MESALIISGTDKILSFLSETLNSASVKQIITLHSCTEARRLLLERDFDLMIVNAPLHDETGEDLSRHIASVGKAQVILMVNSEYFDAVSSVCEEDGVLTVSKPVNESVFWAALMLAKSAQHRIKKIQIENAELKQKIEDIRIINQAKMILISCMNMSEKEAHRHIEKQAMDLRATRRIVAEGILKNYN